MLLTLILFFFASAGEAWAFSCIFSTTLSIIHYKLSIKHIFLADFADDSEIIIIFVPSEPEMEVIRGR